MGENLELNFFTGLFKIINFRGLSAFILGIMINCSDTL